MVLKNVVSRGKQHGEWFSVVHGSHAVVEDAYSFITVTY